VVEPVAGSVVGPDAGTAVAGRACPHQDRRRGSVMNSGIHTVIYPSRGDVRDVGGGKLVVTLTDPDGNLFGLSQEP
jgi:hypothetical protein